MQHNLTKSRLCLSLSTLFLSLNLHANEVNFVQLPEATGEAATRLQEVGHYNPTGLGNNTAIGRVTSEIFTIINGRMYAQQQQSCFGDSRLTPSGAYILPGVLVVDVTNPRGSPPLIGRIPTSTFPSYTPPDISSIPPQWQRSSAGFVTSGKMNSGDILMIGVNGSNCNPLFGPRPNPITGPYSGGGLNGFELWDVSDPDPAKAKFLSFTQIFDKNPILAEDWANQNKTENGSRGYTLESADLFKQGNKDYMITISEGVRVFDITDPKHPQEISYWSTPLQQFPGIDIASLNNLGTSDPSLRVYQDFLNTFAPYLAVGYDVRGAYPGNSPVSLRLIDNKTAIIGAVNYGMVVLDLSHLPNIEVKSISKNLEDAARASAVGASYAVMTPNDKVIAERASFDSTFTKLVINNEPNFTTLAAEFGFTAKIANPPFNGVFDANQLVYVGQACPQNTQPTIPLATSPDQVALVLRGTCTFQVKANNVVAAGYKGMLVMNQESTGEAAANGTGTGSPIPGVGTTYYQGLRIFDPALVAGKPVPVIFSAYTVDYFNLPTNCSGLTPPQYCGQIAKSGVRVTSDFIKAGHLRIWDAKNGEPQLVSTVDTYCSNNIADPNCQVTLTGHSVNVPTIVDNKTVAAPWYTDGLVLIDIGDPSAPKLIAQWKPSGDAFVAQNGGLPLASVFTVYDQASGCYFVSDIRGGIYILDDVKSGPDCKKVNQVITP